MSIRQKAGPLFDQRVEIHTFAAGGDHSLFLKTDGTAWGCGYNYFGHLGDGTTETRSTPVQVLPGVKAIAAGDKHSIFLKTDGTAWTCGYNYYGHLGDGTTTNRSTPVQVLTGVKAIAAGYSCSLFLKTDNSVWVTGYNGQGQLGTGNYTDRTTPVQILTGVQAISAGYDRCLFLKSDGSVWAAGSQVGDGTSTNRPTPVQILTGVQAISAGESHSLFLKMDGSVWATGSNDNGQFGNGTAAGMSSPAQVFTGATAVSAGYYHSIFLKTDGTVCTAGDNADGQLGIGAGVADQSTPVQVFQLFTPTLPSVSSPLFSNITSTTATLGGNVTDEGSSATITRGVVCSPTAISSNPLIGGAGVTNLTSSGSTGVFTVNASGLTPGIAYTFKAYATNSVGTGYSITGSFITLGVPEIAVEEAGANILDGGSMNFGGVALGAASPSHTFTIRNTGSGNLTGLVVAKDGASPGDFIVVGPASASVAGGGSTTFTVTFTPAAAGSRSCVFHLASNDPVENPFDITLTGIGTSSVLLALAQSAYLKPSSTASEDFFGFSVAVAGDTVVIGTPEGSNRGVVDHSSGAAYVFRRSGGSWTQEAKLKAGNPGADDSFGYAVAVSGDTIVVGAWGEDSGTTGVNSTPNESAINSGAAYVFTRVGTTWSQQAYLKASNTGAGDGFGTSVAVSGDTAIIGAADEDGGTPGVNGVSNENAADSGACYVFVRVGAVWTQQAYLKAGNPGAGDGFGTSVAVAGDTVAVGASGEDSSTTGVNSAPNELASDSGAAYVFTRSGTTWTQQAYLKAGNTGAGDAFGEAVAVAGDTVAIGAPGEGSGSAGVNSTPDESAASAGAAYIFIRSGNTWTQQAYLKAGNPGAGDNFGDSVAISGENVVVGATFEASSTTGVNNTPNESAPFAGAAYVFSRTGTVWSQQAYLKASNPDSLDYFGSSVAISGDTVVVGAPAEASSTTGVNSIPNNDATYAGAAYLFNGVSNPDIAVEYPEYVSLVNHAATIDCGNHLVNGGGSEPTLSFVIRNTGSATLTLQDFVVTGPASDDFTFDLAGYVDIPPGESRVVWAWFHPSVVGTRSATLEILSDDPDENPFTITLTGMGLSYAEAWRKTFFNDTANTGNAADNADPDHDGLVNLLERAFNLIPTQPGRPILTSGTGTSGLPFITTAQGPSGPALSIQYLRHKASTNSGLTYTPQFCSDLTDSDPGGWSAATGTETVESIDSEWERVTVTDTAPASSTRFGRVKITASP